MLRLGAVAVKVRTMVRRSVDSAGMTTTVEVTVMYSVVSKNPVLGWICENPTGDVDSNVERGRRAVALRRRDASSARGGGDGIHSLGGGD